MVEPHPLLFLVPNNMVMPVPWDRPFTEPIALPKGKKLVSLRDAALYITKLPKAEHDAEAWQAAMRRSCWLPIVCANRRDASSTDTSSGCSERCARTSIGKAEIEERPMTEPGLFRRLDAGLTGAVAGTMSSYQSLRTDVPCRAPERSGALVVCENHPGFRA
jgi:hypothetical protein